jgi:phospholipid/cholesterol/gamma-HCH transport system substrate-binding protein
VKVSKEVKAGLIAVFAIAGFVYLFQYMKGKSFFTTNNTYYTKCDNVSGLAPSSVVSINGLKVGHVDKIVPYKSKNGKLYFVVKMVIDDKFEISKNSVFEFFQPSMITPDKEVNINFVYDGSIAKDGDTLKSVLNSGIMGSVSSEDVEQTKLQLQSVLKRVDSLTNNANKIFDEQNRAEIKALLQNLNRTIASFENTSRQTNALISNTDPKLQQVLDNANLATASAKNTLDKFGTVAENMDVQKLNNAVDKLSSTADKLNTLIAGIQNGEGNLGKFAKDEELYKNLTETAASMNALLVDFKAHPKRYVHFSVFGKKDK